MTDRDPAPPKNPARAAREKRLAEALRANLRRRKGAKASNTAKAEGQPENGRPSEGGSRGGR